MNKRINEAIEAGTLAADLFGNHYPTVTDRNGQPTAEPRQDNGRATAKLRRNHGAHARTERTVFTDLTAAARPLTAIVPYITADTIAITMPNYRKYIVAYNDMIIDANAAIATYNDHVRKFREENKPTETQLEFSRHFVIKNRRITNRKIYNELVEEFNQERGQLVEKKKLIPVKYATELVFRQMLHLYAMQLAKYAPQLLQLGVTEAKPIRQFELNPHHITNLRRDEIQALDVCNATIRNHRDRLEECGILLDYRFRGHTIGINYHINSCILAVYDAKTGKMVGAENQSVTLETCKEFIVNNEATRSIKRNINKRENADRDFPINGTPAAVPLNSFYKNIPVQGAESTPGGAPENVKFLRTLSEKLLDTIEHEHQLAEKLSAGIYNSHTPIDIRDLEKEAYRGTLTRDEMKAVVIQDIFRTSARMWRTTTPFPGSWKIAINEWMEKRFVTGNGNGKWTMSKDHIYELVKEYRWRIVNAERWFKKTGIKPLYPGDYFDFTRQEKKEIGFEYTRALWLKHKKYEAAKPQKELKTRKKAAARKSQINHAKKFENEINRFFRNRITFEHLHEYVMRNLPGEYEQKLAQTVINLSVAKVKYTIHEMPDA